MFDQAMKQERSTRWKKFSHWSMWFPPLRRRFSVLTEQPYFNLFLAGAWSLAWLDLLGSR